MQATTENTTPASTLFLELTRFLERTRLLEEVLRSAITWVVSPSAAAANGYSMAGLEVAKEANNSLCGACDLAIDGLLSSVCSSR